MKKENIGIGYKVFDKDWKCRDFQFEVGKEYKHKGIIELCSSGFHFCPTLVDCFNYYDWDSENKVTIVHYDKTKTLTPDGSDKYVTSHIKIEKEISWDDVMKMCNIGKFCTGHRNTGDWNTGDRNAGDRNTGDRNTGDWNTGDRNTGDRNAGDRNAGDWNTGFFNTSEPKTRLFNKDSDISFYDIFNSDWYNLLSRKHITCELIFFSDMTEKEKEDHKYAETTGGYIKYYEYKESWKIMFDKLSKEEIGIIKSIPNFDKEIFFEISGLNV